MTVSRDIVIRAGQTFELSLPYAGTAGRGQRAHIRWSDGTATVVQILTHNGDTNARVLFNGTDAIDITIGASVSAAWVVGAMRVEWVYDIEDYDLSDVDDVVITHSGKCIVYGNRTRESDITPSDQMPSGDGRYVRFDGEQGLSAGQQEQAQLNILGEVYAPGGGPGDVVGPASATDGRIAEFDGATGKLLRQASYTIASLLAAAYARASHTGTQLAATISDFATAAITAVTWSTLTGKPSTFDPSAHKTSHATGGGDALTALDIGAQSADATLTAVAALDSSAGLVEQTGADTFTKRAIGVGASTSIPTRGDADTRYAGAAHDHTGTYQPLATVLTNTTAAFTTTQETKLTGIEALADVTDAGNVGTAIDGATAKTTPVDADTVALIDSAAGNALKKLSWANIKATAKSYFDTLYQAASATLTTWAGITPAANVGTFLGAPSSANLAAAVTDETGSGALVFATSPTLVTPALGTPSSGNLGNCTFPAISGLTGFTAAESTSSPNATVPVASLTANNAATNVDAALRPKGTGAVLAHVPDGTATGGNKRSIYSVDFQVWRSAAAMVAGGTAAAILGGRDNTASGNYSAVLGGRDNTASGNYSAVMGGNGNTASGTYAAVAGNNNTASASGSIALGGGANIADGANSWVPGGLYASLRGIFGAGAYSASRRTVTGDRQTMVLPIACAARTDATATVMTSDAGAASTTNQMVLPNNSSMFFEVDVVAHDSTLKSASWKVQGTIRRGANAAATAIVGTNVTTTFGSDLSGGSPGVTCTADTTNGALAVTFTGIAATTIYPSGHIRTVIAA